MIGQDDRGKYESRKIGNCISISMLKRLWTPLIQGPSSYVFCLGTFTPYAEDVSIKQCSRSWATSSPSSRWAIVVVHLVVSEFPKTPRV